MVVRIQKKTTTGFEVKIYGPNESLIISVLKTFMTEFDECEIVTKEETFGREKLMLDLKYSLLEEVSHMKAKPEKDLKVFIKDQSTKEASSDVAYIGLCSLISSERSKDPKETHVSKCKRLKICIF